MARTPLLRSLRQLARDTSASKVSGIPVDEIRDIRAERKLSRRGFLAGAAVGAAALTLPTARARASGSSKAAAQPSVTIIGGGIAGLSCALQLRDKGYDSTVYEANTRLGGRMFSNPNYFAGGQVSEWCGELIDTGHTTIRKLAKRYKLPLDNLHNAEPASSTDTYYFDGKYYAKKQADADFLDIFDIITADSDAADYPTTFDMYTQAGFELDHMSVREWINTRVPGGIHSNLGQLLDVAYNIEYGADTCKQSALNLLYLLAFQPTATQLDVFGESDETFHIRGGNQQLPLAIAADLGDQIVTGQRLVRLERTSTGRYKSTFDRGCGTSEVISDFVVLALPFAQLANVDTSRAGFDSRKNDAIQHLGRGHNGKLNMQFTSRVWNNNGPWGGKSTGSSYSDNGIQATWDVTRAQAGSQGILVNYSGGANTDSKHADRAYVTVEQDGGALRDAQDSLTRMRQIFPGLEWTGRATSSLPHKSPYLGLAYSYWQIGQYTRFGGYEGVAQGNIHFCGEHTSQDFQGFMEGGASTGKGAANEIINELK